MAVTDENHVAVFHVLQRHCDGTVSAVAHLLNTFAPGASMCPHQPVGHGFVDLVGGQALVGAVVPFGEHVRDFVDGEPRKLCRFHGPVPRAADHEWVHEIEFSQHTAGKLGSVPSVIGQLDIGAARVLTGFRPLGLAVAEQEQSMVVQAHAD